MVAGAIGHEKFLSHFPICHSHRDMTSFPKRVRPVSCPLSRWTYTPDRSDNNCPILRIYCTYYLLMLQPQTETEEMAKQGGCRRSREGMGGRKAAAVIQAIVSIHAIGSRA